MPLRRDPGGGGRNADGSRNDDYCSLCFRDGAFVDPAMTLEAMQSLVAGKLREMGFPGFLARWIAARTRRLKRWRDGAH